MFGGEYTLFLFFTNFALTAKIRWENIALSTEFIGYFCAGIGPLQLGVVLVMPILDDRLKEKILKP